MDKLRATFDRETAERTLHSFGVEIMYGGTEYIRYVNCAYYFAGYLAIITYFSP